MNKRRNSRILYVIAAMFLWVQVPGNGLAAETGLHLLPIPHHITMGSGRLPVRDDFQVALTSAEGAYPGLEKAARRFLERVQKQTGIPLSSKPLADPGSATLEIFCTGTVEPVQSVRTDESYTLEISNSQARLSASSPAGVFRGLETFLQLIDIDTQSFFVPSIKIEDHPRFQWRGLLIDVSRHFEPVEILKRNLDAMAAVKMNVLHLHLSDDQGFRVESKIFPKLHQLGSDGKYYSQSEVHEIITYARDRGIRVVPEFDMPGHSTSWMVAYPELASAPGPYTIERKWGVFEPSMDPTKEAVYKFLDAFIGEMAGLFPDEYFHIGGDEVKAKQWNSSERIRDFKKRHNLSSNHDLQVYFNQRVLGILTKHEKKMIGWDEILHPELPKNIIVQSWRKDSHAKTARQGYSGILSRGYYLDHMRPASFHYSVDPLGNETADLTEEEKRHILGGEACMWAEFVNPENIESRIWPRAAAIAERLWSPPEANNIQDLYRRLEFIDRELTALGLQHRVLYLENLQRMAGNVDIQPLILFADLLKPPSLAIRKRARTYFSHTPLNRLVDVLIPESKVAREFADLVERMQTHPEDSAETIKKIRDVLTRWEHNNAPLQSIIQRSYLLKETQSLAESIIELCRHGIEALNYLESHRQPPKAWRDETSVFLKRVEQPQAEIYIAVLPPIEKLIEKATALP